MKTTIPHFLKDVPLPARLVVQRGLLALASVDRAMETAALESAGDPTCELQVAGRTLAEGRVIKRFGYWYFQVQTVNEGDKS